MRKDFDGWNEVKKRTHEQSSRFYKAREIWWCRIGANIGSEQDGKGILFSRPCLIVRGFGQDSCIIVPLTTSKYAHRFRIPAGEVAGKEVKANISQMRVVDTRRFEGLIELMDGKIFSKIRTAIRDLFA